MSIHTDAQTIIQEALTACLPDQAVRRALEGRTFGAGRVFLVAVGKAAWQMAHCAARLLGDRLEAGVVVTKHGHSRGEIPRCAVYEGGHPGGHGAGGASDGGGHGGVPGVRRGLRPV